METKLSRIDNLFDYFHEQVEDAQRASSLGLSADTSLYIATMLVDRARTDRPNLPDADTLAELHARAAHAPPAERARTYRELGDRALYITGYFRESVERGNVGVRYYEDMGAAAYHQVDSVFKRWFADAFGPVFEELSVGFRGCVELLSRVRRVQDERPDPIARLYAEWLETRSAEVADKLHEMGLLVPGGGRGETVH